jgi:hypothetical protein
VANVYDEIQHPRGTAGKFSPKPKSTRKTKNKKRKKFAHLAIPSHEAIKLRMQGRAGKTNKVPGIK